MIVTRATVDCPTCGMTEEVQVSVLRQGPTAFDILFDRPVFHRCPDPTRDRRPDDDRDGLDMTRPNIPSV